jgi:enolase
MAKIKTIKAREILDSRGNPTVETTVTLDNGARAVASVPSGASLGKYEALELRDKDPDHYQGMGVLKAIANVNEVIAPQLAGTDPAGQRQIDEALINLDGTENKSKLGANAILSVSQSICKAGALATKQPLYEHLAQLSGSIKEGFRLPAPIFNIINGGKHGAGNLDFQEFHVIPVAQPSFAEALETGEEIYQTVKKVLIRHKAIHSVGDEGGFAPDLFTNLDALEILIEAIRETEHRFRRDVVFGLDVAASHFFQAGKYKIRDRILPMETSEFTDYFIDLNKQYPLFMIEDPFHEDDWDGWKKILEALPEAVVVGDDLLATNQTGTVSETIEVVKIARQAGWKVTVSHRSGETNDDFIADFALGVGADFVKFGAPARGERVVKLNRLLRIEEELKDE